MPSSKLTKGVFITYTADYAAELNESAPILTSQPLPGNYLRYSPELWQALPLTSALGIPLKVMRLDALDQNGPHYYKEAVSILSICPDVSFVNFCKPTTYADFSAFIARVDNTDLEPEVWAAIEFVKKEMPELVAAARDRTDGEETDVGEDVENSWGNRKKCSIGKAKGLAFGKYLVEQEA